MSNKTRLDVLLVERGFAPTRQKAQAIIMAGSVFVAGQRVDKPGTAVANEAELEVRGHTLRCASTPSTSAMASSTGSSAATSASSVWSGRTRAI